MAPLDGNPADFTPLSVPETETDEILRTLIEADRLLSGPEKWCQFALERDGAYCALGAVDAAGRRTGKAAGGYLSLQVAIMTGNGMISDYNNAPERTFSDIKTLFAKAIAARRAELAEGS